MLKKVDERKQLYDTFASLAFWTALPIDLKNLKISLDIMTDEEVRRLKTILKVRLND